jgi:acetyltransferase-like isoleucine patch superfamily enzyme
VRIATCMILGHDGTVNMINRALGLHLDSVGKIDIRDNVYIGYHAVVLPGVTIGPNAIVSAGSVVQLLSGALARDALKLCYAEAESLAVGEIVALI